MGLIDNMKELADLIKKAGDVDLYRKIVESEGEVMDLTREKRQLEDRVRELEGLLALQKIMVFKEPFFWQEGDGTPFCPACWEDKRAAIHLFLVFDNLERIRRDCPACKSVYTVNKGGARRSSEGAGPSGSGPQGWMR
jgi:hypothetical protein